jgi:hypothetical protein
MIIEKMLHDSRTVQILSFGITSDGVLHFSRLVSRPIVGNLGARQASIAFHTISITELILSLRNVTYGHIGDDDRTTIYAIH